MESKRERLVDTARSYVGYLEKATNSRLEDFTANAGAGNWTIFGKWYGLNGQPWCAIFVSFCAAQAGLLESAIPKHASCSAGVAWFKEAGRWRERSSGYVPQPGDIVYFTRDGKSPVHVGIVERAESGRVYTIEGNTSGGDGLAENGGCVAEKSYPLSSAYILGYGAPEYGEETEMTYEQWKEYMARYEAERASAGPSAWSAEARMWAERNGIITGDDKGNFQYKAACTREQMVVFLHRVYRLITGK